MSNNSGDLPSPFKNVPIEIKVCVGKARPTISEVFLFKKNTVLLLDQSVNDPVHLFIGDRLVAYGELQEVNDDDSGQLAVKLISVVDFNE